MKRITIALFTMLALTCCKKESVEENPDKTSETGKIALADVTHLDLSNAKAITVHSSADEEYIFSKVTDNGQLTQIALMANDVEYTTDYTAEFIRDINEEYAFIELFDEDWRYEHFLLEKSTGKLFNTDIYIRDYNKMDANNNVYYTNDALYRVNLDNPSSLTQEAVSNTEVALGFAVSDNGEVVYSSYSNDYVMRAVSSDGKIEVISGYGAPYKGLDGNLIYFTEKGDNKDIYLATVSFDPISVEYSQSAFDMYVGEYPSIETVKNKEMFVCKSTYGLSHFNANNELTTAIKTSDWDVDYFSRIESTDDHYYISYQANSGKSVLKKVNPLSPKTDYTELINGEYELYNFWLAEDDVVYFSATQTNTVEKVFGKISSEGEISIISNDFSRYAQFVALQ